MKIKSILLALALASGTIVAQAQNYQGYPGQNGSNNGVYRNDRDAQYYNQITGGSGSDVGRGHYQYNPFTGRTEWVPNQ
jgi:hypothetical protein